MDSSFQAFTIVENQDGSFASQIISKNIDDLPPCDIFTKI
jgi:hypothetical protein|tara:strand:- start:59 stop:178 length:120 start_codon:yes stop_codon:yes gene_type:complete